MKNFYNSIIRQDYSILKSGEEEELGRKRFGQADVESSSHSHTPFGGAYLNPSAMFHPWREQPGEAGLNTKVTVDLRGQELGPARQFCSSQ